jgi:hypothetical protein
VRLGKTLAKIGLAVDRGAMIISNQAIWRSISIMELVYFRLPSITNALEFFHGHGNEETPGRSDFIHPVVRVATMMIRKTLSFETTLHDSFRVMICTARRRAKFTDAAIFASEVQHYHTTPEHCDCGETCHLSEMYRTSSRCSHQYFIGDPKPGRPDLHLELREQPSTLTVEIEHIDPTMPRIFALQAEKWKNHAVKQIKRFAYSMKTVEIQAYVEQHFRIGGRFALGIWFDQRWN